MLAWLKAKFWTPLLALLQQGLSPSKLALSVTLGVWIAVFPALGVTTALCAVVALALGLNMVAIQTVNYAAYPLQILLIFPFFRAGEWLFNAEPLQMSVGEFVHFVTHEPRAAIDKLWWVTWHGAAVWALLGLVIVPAAWALLTALFSRIALRQKDQPA